MNGLQPAEAVPDVPPQLRAVSIRDLRNDPSLAPGGGAFVSVLAEFLPIVNGTALKLVPENPVAVPKIAMAVFECFAAKWKHLSKRTLVGPWLVEATRSVALRERKRLRLPKPARGSSAAEHFLLFRRLSQLKPKLRNALVLRHLLQVPNPETAVALHTSTVRSERYSGKAFTWLRRKLRKTKLGANLWDAFDGLRAAPPEEVSAPILERLGRWTPTVPQSELTRSTLIGWRWLAVRLFFKRVLAGLGAVVCVVLALAGTFVFLFTHGYLNDFAMNMGNRELARDFPEALTPAGSWPVTDQDQAYAKKESPKTSAELYQPTNIWLARFSFTEEQWDALQPTRIPPVRNLFQDGRITLRNPKAKRSGLSGAIGYEFNWTEARVEFAGEKFERAAVRYRGNGTFLQSRYGPKQSFKVDFNKFEKKRSIAGIDELNFVNAVPDFSYVRDAMSQLVFHELGVPSPRTAYAYVSVDVPGKWTNQALGLYCLIENIDKDFADDRFGSKKVPIFKPVTYDLFQDLGSEWNNYAQIYDLKTEATSEQLQRVIEFARFVTQASDEEFSKKLGEYLDIEEFAAFVAGHALLSSYDGFFTNGQNYYLYLDPASKKFGFISWDQDHSWGEFGYVGTAESREQASIWEPAVYDFQFLQRVMRVPAFRDAYKSKLQGALDTFFTKERLYPQIDQLAAAIRAAVAAESEFRLKRFDQSISSEWLPGDRNSGPSEGPRAPVHQIKRFIENRIVSVRNQLEGESDGVRLKRGR